MAFVLLDRMVLVHHRVNCTNAMNRGYTKITMGTTDEATDESDFWKLMFKPSLWPSYVLFQS